MAKSEASAYALISRAITVSWARRRHGRTYGVPRLPARLRM